MNTAIYFLFKKAILPPTINFIAVILGWLLLKRLRFLGQCLVFIGGVSLVLFSVPQVAYFLMQGLQQYPALAPPVVMADEQAIVVLSSGKYLNAKEYGRDVDGPLSLERNHYAAFLHKQTGLPILVTGGGSHQVSYAATMAETLINSFNVHTVWKEEQSWNTAENATYSAAFLKPKGIHSVYLVTHELHMRRAVMVFEQAGLKVTPAPTILIKPEQGYLKYMPSAKGLLQTSSVLHEYIGIAWYWLRYNQS